MRAVRNKRKTVATSVPYDTEHTVGAITRRYIMIILRHPKYMVFPLHCSNNAGIR